MCTFLFLQSLVERLQLNAEDITIQPVHPSIIGQDTWFQITYTSSGTTRYFSCQSSKERDEWISSLKKTLMLNEDQRKTDNSLKLDVLEIKGLGDKKKYYVEILIDDKLYARTSSKKITDACCMWCESFGFADLPFNTEKITLLVHKDKGNGTGGQNASRKKPKKPVGRVKISVASVTSRYVQDKWYPVEKSNRREAPSIRLRAQYQSIDILPLTDYEEFLYFLKDEYKDLCKLLEPNISVKVKEELSNNLMNVFHAEEMAEDVLADLVVDEISHLENEHLTFRGNSIATKAMECYIKLVGGQYLLSTLQTVISDIISATELDLEIDPIKVASNDVLSLHRQNLLSVVRQVWNRIVKSHAYFPVQLQRCFYKIRQYLAHVGQPDLGDNLISSCIFLRYLCPAVLTPSLFSLTDEFPGEKANRNLTLVAKTLQTLANFTRYESKENSMEFLNTFLSEETDTMKTYLRQISSPLAEDCWIPSLSYPVEKSDLGKYLSSLHTILFENVSKLPIDNQKSVKLRQLLDDINSILKRPTIPQLEKISQPTLDTLKMKQETTKSETKTFAGIPIPWLGTLPKKSKNNGLSHPAPHHSATNLVLKSTSTASVKSPMNTAMGMNEGVSLSSETSSSSTSPSPGGPMKGRSTWHTADGGTSSSSSSSVILGSGATGRHSHHTSTLDPYLLHQRRSSKMKTFPSSMSLDETDSSDDSTYSSQYQSDANSTPRTGTSHTLPRNLPRPQTASSMGSANNHHSTSVVKVKSMSDYESEILQMRSEMEQLQCKLSEAERQLSFNHTNNQNNTASIKDDHHQRTMTQVVGESQEASKDVVARLMREEDKLRREHLDIQMSSAEDPMSDKERMIMMQQKKIAALDAANRRLLEELNKLSSSQQQQLQSSGNSSSTGATTTPSGSSTAKVSVTTSPINVTSINTSSNTVSHDRRVSSSSTSSNKSITVITNGEATTVKANSLPANTSGLPPAPPGTSNGSGSASGPASSASQETPKTVDELLDSLHSTSI